MSYAKTVDGQVFVHAQRPIVEDLLHGQVEDLALDVVVDAVSLLCRDRSGNHGRPRASGVPSASRW